MLSSKETDPISDLPMEVKINTLVNANLQEFNRMCRLNKHLYNVCYNSSHSERIFKDKTELYYPELSKFKTEKTDMTWRRFFEKAVQLFSLLEKSQDKTKIADLMVKKGKLMEVDLLMEYSIKPSEGAAKVALLNGDEDMTNFLLQRGYNVDFVSVVAAADKGYIDLVDRFIVFNPSFNEEVADTLVDNGNLGAVQWFARHNVFPSQGAINEAAERGNMKMLKLLATFRRFPTDAALRVITEAGRLDILKWLYANNIRDTDQVAFNAVESGHLDIIKWLYSLGEIRDAWLVNEAAENGHLEVVKWLYSKGLKPDPYAVREAIARGHQHIAVWLISKGMDPAKISYD